MKLIATNRPGKDVTKFLSEAKGMPDFEIAKHGNLFEIEVEEDDAEDLAFILESYGVDCELEGDDEEHLFQTPRLISSRTPKTRLGAGTDGHIQKNQAWRKK